MEIQLDYDMMAESVYALSALAAFETGGERVIGRNEGNALRNRFQLALMDVCLKLRPAVKRLLAHTGLVELTADGDSVHHALSAAVLQRVLAELGLDTEETAEKYMRLLKSMVDPLPYLESHS